MLQAPGPLQVTVYVTDWSADWYENENGNADWPAGPGGPCGPASPAGPRPPGSPFGPAGPVGPGSPPGPIPPAGPLGPAGPDIAFPASPFGPPTPAGPRGPVGPAGPAGPTGPVGPAGPIGPVTASTTAGGDDTSVGVIPTAVSFAASIWRAVSTSVSRAASAARSRSVSEASSEIRIQLARRPHTKPTAISSVTRNRQSKTCRSRFRRFIVSLRSRSQCRPQPRSPTPERSASPT